MVRFGAVGDIALYKWTADAMSGHGYDWPFEKMRGCLAQADVLFGNLECPFLPDDYPADQIDPRALLCYLPARDCCAAMRRAGFDYLSLGNNHVLDLGAKGLDFTRRALKDEGLLTGGAGHSQEDARKPALLKRKGITFAFLSYCEDNNYSLGQTAPGPAYYELDSVIEDVQAIRGSADIVVVSIHADIEFMPVPSPGRRDTSRKIAEAGANIILEHHPHVPQGVEVAGKCLIAYSLGNFVFNAHTDAYMKGNGPHTARSFMLLVDVTMDGVQAFSRIPYEIPLPPEERPTPLSGRQEQEMLDYLADLDRKLQDDEFIRTTWQKTARKLLETYLRRVQDCSADDVIQELVGRLCIVAENRGWVQEIFEMGKQAWEEQQRVIDELHRPHNKFTMK